MINFAPGCLGGCSCRSLNQEAQGKPKSHVPNDIQCEIVEPRSHILVNGPRSIEQKLIPDTDIKRLREALSVFWTANRQFDTIEEILQIHADDRLHVDDGFQSERIGQISPLPGMFIVVSDRNNIVISVASDLKSVSKAQSLSDDKKPTLS